VPKPVSVDSNQLPNLTTSVPPLVPRNISPELRAKLFPENRRIGAHRDPGLTQQLSKSRVLETSESPTAQEDSPEQTATGSQPQHARHNHGRIYQNETPSCNAACKPEYRSLFEKYGKRYNLDPNLLAAVAEAESDFNPRAVSVKGARGLMQLMPETAHDMGVRNSFNPEENVKGGARYLNGLVEKFGDLKLALAAYNAGPGNVEKYGGVPPFRETEKYVERVMNNYSDLIT
jgi:soluble lytic murein transglycosylase-like protein